MAATTILQRVDLDYVSQQAREASFGRTALTVIAGMLFGLGWLTAKVVGGLGWLTARVFRALWLGLAWTAVCIREGWREGRAGSARSAHAVPNLE